jgi:CO dehydrogenase/acetyl-CoA synthase beta subunit
MPRSRANYDTVVDKCQVRLCTVPEKLKDMRVEANVIYENRDERPEVAD